jgi:hypothetical protein
MNELPPADQGESYIEGLLRVIEASDRFRPGLSFISKM